MNTTLPYLQYLVLLSLVVFSSNFAAAQAYIFNAYEQEYYQPLNNPTSLNNDLTWDDPYYSIPVGFDFMYENQIVDTLYLSGLGGKLFFQDLVGFNVEDSSAVLHALNITTIDLMDRAMANLSEEGTPGSLSPISYQTEGYQGEQILKVEWINAGSYDEIKADSISSDFVNMQVWFFEGSNNIEIRYGESQILSPNETYQGHPGEIISIGPSDWSFAYPDVESLSTSFVVGEASAPTLLSVSSENTLEFDNLYIQGLIPYGTIYQFATTPEFVDTIADPPIALALTGTNAAIDLVIYPNPTSDAFSLQGISKPTTINIYNSKGQLLKKLAISPNELIRLDDLAKGIYFVEVWIEEQWIRRQLIKN